MNTINNSELSLENQVPLFIDAKTKLDAVALTSGTRSCILRDFITEVFTYGFTDEPFYDKLVHLLTC